MSSVHIRDVQPATLDALKRLARSHHRSLQGELRAILDRAAQFAPPDEDTRLLDLVTTRTGHAASWNRDEIYGPEGR